MKEGFYMLYKTHLTTTACIAIPIFEIKHEFGILAMSGVLIGALLPDIDEPNSIMGRKFPIISETLNKVLGHRGAIHSIFPVLGLLVLTNLSKYIWNGLYIFLGTLTLGFFLHLIEDTFSYMGIKWLAPIINLDFKCPIYSLRYKVGGIKEYIILFLGIFIILLELNIFHIINLKFLF